MSIDKVQNPDQINRSRGVVFQEPYKDRYRLNNSWDRFNSNYSIGYGGIIRSRGTYQGFKGYGLHIHDLLGIRSYERTGEIERIIRERTGEPYLIGIELEIERVRDRDRVGEILARTLPDRHICVRDGSIGSDGIEIVTSPLAPREIGRIPWYNLLRSLSRAGCTSHDSGACGLHVSISRTYLQDRTWRSIRSMLSKDRALFESLSRRTIGKGSNSSDPFYFCQFTPRDSKYSALNLSKSKVAEFRFFRGTLAPWSFLASIEICRSLVEYANDRERSGSVRLSVKGWIKYMSDRGSFGVACEYVREHADRYLNAPRAPRAPRARAGERVARFLRERSRAGVYQINGTGEIEVEPGYTSDRMIQSLCVGGYVLGDTTVEHRIPIAWERSTGLPQYIRDAITRGSAPREIVIRSQYIPDPNGGTIANRAIYFTHYRGGWGTRSALYTHNTTIGQ